jgi:hypothetical protein
VLYNEELRWQYLTAGAVTLLLGYLLAVLTVACYSFADHATDSNERGFIPAARKRPIRVAIILCAVALIILAIWEIDLFLQPKAWSPRCFIAFQRAERPMASTGTTNPEAHVRLSHDGKWLSFSVFDLRLEGETYVIQLHQLEPQVRRVRLPPINTATSTRSLPEFSCDEDRCSYLVHANSSAGLFPGPGAEVHVFSLKTGQDEVLEDAGHNLIWLPGRKLIVDDREFIKDSDGWSVKEIEELPEYHPRLGYAVYRILGLVQIVDLASSRETASWPSPLAWPAPDQDEVFSPDGRFGLIYNEIRDHQLHTVRTWEADDNLPMFLHTFTGSGHAVGTRSDWANGIAFHLPWLSYVPFGDKLLHWLWRQPICLIDPATGKEVARTQPLWSEPDDIAFSFDGSRMAVINLEGVYIYDVPAEFR